MNQTIRDPLRFLVTGAAGFVGSHVAEALIQQGHQVVGVDGFVKSYARRMKQANLSWLRQQPTFRFAEADLRTAPLEGLLEGVDVVVNEAAFAGLPRSWTDLDSYIECNVTALGRLIDASSRAGVHRFVQASTSSVYGTSAVGDEDTPTRPVSPYGVSKLAAEHLLLAHVDSHGFPAVILRYFSIYGPRQRPDMAYRIFMECLLDGHPVTLYGDGEQSRSNTFVSDCVRATLLAIDHGGVGEVYNIGGGQELRLRDAVDLIAEEIGVSPSILHRETRVGDQRRTVADISKARRELGYTPTVTPRVGLRAQLDWLLSMRCQLALGEPVLEDQRLAPAV